jgi:hypothetical protein
MAIADVANQNQPWARAIIYGKFDDSNTSPGNVQPGCELDASWPADYGDIYVREDFCLYDSGG